MVSRVQRKRRLGISFFPALIDRGLQNPGMSIAGTRSVTQKREESKSSGGILCYLFLRIPPYFAIITFLKFNPKPKQISTKNNPFRKGVILLQNGLFFIFLLCSRYGWHLKLQSPTRRHLQKPRPTYWRILTRPAPKLSV